MVCSRTRMGTRTHVPLHKVQARVRASARTTVSRPRRAGAVPKTTRLLCSRSGPAGRLEAGARPHRERTAQACSQQHSSGVLPTARI